MGNAKGFSRFNRAVLILTALSATSAAATPPQCPSVNALAVGDAVRPFTQVRTLPSLPKPIHSSGVLQAAGEQFIWRICDPFDIRTTVGPDGISQSVEGGAPQPVGPQAMQQAIRQISIADIFQGRFDHLGDVFTVDITDAASTKGRWRVGLTPHGGGASAVINRIDIHGCDDVASVTIIYQDGGRDDIDVGPPMPGAAANCVAE